MELQIWLARLAILATLPFSTLANRIIDGEVAVLGQFPFMVVLVHPMENNDTVLCSGSIVSRNWVVSAAHCTELPGAYTLMAAIVTIKEKESRTQIRNATRIVNHPQYAKVSEGGIEVTMFDISLIKVEEPFIWNEFVKPINLENQIAEYGPEECMNIGFGLSSLSNLTMFGELRYMNVSSKVIYCLKGHRNQPEETLLCSGTVGFTIFKADSGGPLVCNNKQASWTLTGETAVLGELPFTAFLTSLMGNQSTVCTATIVSQSWLITGCHCTSKTGFHTLLAGIVDVKEIGPHVQIRSVIRFIIHPAYKRYALGSLKFIVNDINLIQVQEPFVWNAFVRPISLVRHYQEYGPGQCVVVAFGISEATHYAELRYLNLSSRVFSCRKSYLLFPRHQLCSRDHEEATIAADSGGPLICNDTLVGIAPWHLQFANLVSLNIHSSIAHFFHWIKNNIDEELYCNPQL